MKVKDWLARGAAHRRSTLLGVGEHLPLLVVAAEAEQFAIGVYLNVARHVPGPDHRRADHQSAEDVVEAAAEVGCFEHEPEDQRGQRQTDHHPADRRPVAEDHLAEILALAQMDRDRPHPVVEQQAHQGLVGAGERADHEVGEGADDQEHHDRFEVAAADPDQALVAAAAGERHADAEHQSAEDVLGQQQVAAAIGREAAADVDKAQVLQQHDAEHRRRDRQQPGAYAAGVAHVHQVRDGAHGAEVGLVDHRAQDQGENEHTQQEGVLRGEEILESHVGTSTPQR